MSIIEYHSLRKDCGFSEEEVASDLKTFTSSNSADKKELHLELLIKYNKSINLGRSLLKNNNELKQTNMELTSKNEELRGIIKKYKEDSEKLSMELNDLNGTFANMSIIDYNIIEKNISIDILFNRIIKKGDLKKTYRAELEKYNELNLGTKAEYGKEMIRQRFIYMCILDELLKE